MTKKNHNIFVRFWRWLNHKELDEIYESALRQNEEFIKTLDSRQRSYYFGLNDSWRKELSRLEKRIHDLEEKS